MQEMPLMASSSYSSSQFDLAKMIGGLPAGQQAAVAQNYLDRRVQAQNFPQPVAAINNAKEPAIMANTRRLVQVLIADPNDNVPLDDCLLYKGDQKLTDLTDQELFFEIDIKSILDAHNAKRGKLVNKAVKERTEYLEPARIRDLKMTVVTVAQF